LLVARRNQRFTTIRSTGVRRYLGIFVYDRIRRLQNRRGRPPISRQRNQLRVQKSLQKEIECFARGTAKAVDALIGIADREDVTAALPFICHPERSRRTCVLARSGPRFPSC